MASKCFPLVRGRVMRATRLDECGRIATSGCSSITTDGFVSVALTANIEEGEEISVTNANGKVCVRDAPKPSFKSYGVQVTFCNVDPELFAMLSNQATVYDSEGDAVGFRMSSSVDTADAGFALELWSGVPGVACDSGNPSAQGSFGYLLLPFVGGGILGDFTLENGAVTFTLQNAATKDGSAWGVGPYDVVPGVGGVPGPLLEPILAGDHLHVQYTTVAPPEPGCICIPSGPPATGATSGTPGTWTPVDSYPPETLTALRASGIVASPTTAWVTGRYVVLGDGSHAHWDGDSWESGNAP